MEPGPYFIPYPGQKENEEIRLPASIAAAKQMHKDIIPYSKYIHEDERERFLSQSQQKQTRELLLQNLETVLWVGGGKLAEGVGAVASPIFKRMFPKTVKNVAKVAETMPKREPEVIVSAGIKLKDGRVFKAPTHHLAIEEMDKAGIGVREWQKVVDDADVFVTSKGRTITRKEAVKLTGEASEDAADIIGHDISRKGQAADGELPKYAGSINLQRQDIPVELKLAELRISETVPKKKVTWTEVDAQSAEIMKDPVKIRKSLEKLKKGQRLTEVDHDVARKANVEALYNFQQKVSKAQTVDEINAITEAYKQQAFVPASEFANEAGRVLQGYNKEIGLNRLGKAFGKLERSLNPREMKAFKGLDLDDPTQIKSFINELGDPKVMDYVYEFWYNSILSGIPTHVVNVASNTAWRAFQVPHRALTGAVDSVIGPIFRGGKRDVFMNETIPLWAGMVKGKPKAAKRAWDMMRHGKITQFEDKWAQEVGASVGAFKRSPYGVLRATGMIIDKPTRALRTMDVYANSLAYDGQMQALAKRAWTKAGKKGNYKEFQKSFIENPTKEAHEEAMDFAKYSTFMSDPGKISNAMLNLRNAPPGEAGRFIIPFVNTIGNLLKRGVEMTPGVGIAMARGQKPAEVIAKQMEGLLITAAVWTKLEAGEMTGAAPENEAERKAFYREGKKAWAMKVGDTWYQYRRAEPFNTVIASAAIAHKRIKNAKDEETATDIMGNIANDFKNNLIDSSYLQGMSQLLNRHGGFGQQPKRLAASMVPFSGFWRSINRSYEAAVEGQAKYRPGRDWIGAFAGVIPGLYKHSQPEISVWGEEIKLEGGVFRQWLPYKWSKGTTDETEIFLEKIGKYPGLPNQWVTHKKERLHLDDDIYRDYVISAGSKAKKKIDARVPLWQGAVQDKKNHPRLITKVQNILDEEWRRGRKIAIKKQRQRDSLIK